MSTGFFLASSEFLDILNVDGATGLFTGRPRASSNIAITNGLFRQLHGGTAHDPMTIAYRQLI